MASESLIAVSALCWLAAAVLSAAGRATALARMLLALGALLSVAFAACNLPGNGPLTTLPLHFAGPPVHFGIPADGLWLLGFGLLPAAGACLLGTPVRQARARWTFGAALSLIGALGVFGLRDGAAFLIAWELMSLGGAVMVTGERLSGDGARGALFMLALLEAGTVAMLLAFVVLADARHGLDFGHYHAAMALLGPAGQTTVAVLLILGFGAKLGLLPFYEWLPAAYASGSGASGALLSGVVLNAAFFGLSRALVDWLPRARPGVVEGVGILVVILGVLSAILAILYAFQEEDWRELLSLSSAENASIAVTALGAALVFRSEGLSDLAGLAWVVAMLHLAGHSLAKGALLLCADGVRRSTGTYAIRQSGVLRNSSWLLGVGAVFAAMSLAAMPPQAGFVSEWYVFQTVFQGFHLSGLAGRLTLAVGGAGLALTAAIAFATFVKVAGIGLLGHDAPRAAPPVPPGACVVVGVLGLGVLALAVGMPWCLEGLRATVQAQFQSNAAGALRDGLMLVPLTARFAFISPTMLVVAMPLLALIPLSLLALSRGAPMRRAPVWFGGLSPPPAEAATTALTFSNALRTFYSFVYRPTVDVSHEHQGPVYFLRRLTFNHQVAPVFGRSLFLPLTQGTVRLARWLRPLQSGHLNAYLALIGLALVLILGLAIF